MIQQPFFWSQQAIRHPSPCKYTRIVDKKIDLLQATLLPLETKTQPPAPASFITKVTKKRKKRALDSEKELIFAKKNT